MKLDNTSYRLYNVDRRRGCRDQPRRQGGEGHAELDLAGRPRGRRRQGRHDLDRATSAKGGKGEVTLADPGEFSRITAMVANVDGDSKRRRKGKRVYTSDDSSYRFSVAPAERAGPGVTGASGRGDGDRDAVEDGVAGERVDEGLVGEQVRVDARRFPRQPTSGRPSVS